MQVHLQVDTTHQQDWRNIDDGVLSFHHCVEQLRVQTQGARRMNPSLFSPEQEINQVQGALWVQEACKEMFRDEHNKVQKVLRFYKYYKRAQFLQSK